MRRQPFSKLIFFLSFIYFPVVSLSQTVGEVLSVGQERIINNRDKLLLKFRGGRVEYDLHQGSSTNFIPLPDSSLFLSRVGSINVYRRPLNPLNFSAEASNQFIPDAIIEAYKTAMESIGKSLTDFTTQLNVEKAVAKQKAKDNQIKNKKKTADPTIYETCKKIEDLISFMDGIHKELKNDQKKAIVDNFKELKTIPFETESQTKLKIDEILNKIEAIQDHFNTVKTSIDDLEKKIAEYDCPEPHPFIVKYIFNDLVSKAMIVLTGQIARYNNLKKAYDQVNAAYLAGSSNDEGLKWMVEQPIEIAGKSEDNNIEVKKGDISRFAVTIYENGLTLSEDEEIVALPKKQAKMAVLKVRQFQRFIPEVVPGFAYTFLKYPKFEVGTDANGNSVVAEAGTDDFKRVNFNVMVNFNYFVPMSIINPFAQIGVGTNTDFPSLFSGLGLRFDLDSKTFKAIAISGGLVSTWIKSLKTLQVGSSVTDKAQLEKDTQHEFKWPPKPYIAFQLRF